MGASVGAHVIIQLSLGIPSGCAQGDGPGLTETGSSLLCWGHLHILDKWSSGLVDCRVEELSIGELTTAISGL